MADYATEAEGTTYMLGKLDSAAWDDAEVGDRNAALTQATRIIDRLNFIGAKNVATQVNEFPRGTETTVPTDVRDASIEVAFALLDGVNPDLERENLNVISQGLSSARTNYDRSFADARIAAGVPSMIAWSLLLPYLRDGQQIATLRST